jgi:SWIM zinc finger
MFCRQDQLSHRQSRAGYLWGRPANVVAALQLRSSRADVMSCQWSACAGRPGCYMVAKSNDTLTQMHFDDVSEGTVPAATSFEQYVAALSPDRHCYHVDFAAGSCSCPDNQMLHMPCKHMFMVMKHSTHTFSQLPASLVSAPTMVIDMEVVQVGWFNRFHYILYTHH